MSNSKRRQEKTYFKIGEVANLFNVGLDAIRYYEEMGLIKPIRDERNGYRRYSVADIEKISMIREMLSLNFSIREIKDFDLNKNLEGTLNILQKELNVIVDRIDALKKQQRSINARIASINEASDLKSIKEIRVLQIEDRHCVMVSNTGIPDEYVGLSTAEYLNRHPQKINTIGGCDCYTLDVKGSNPDSEYLKSKNVFFYSAEMNYQHNYTLPGGIYLSLTYEGSLKQTKKLLPVIYKYAEENGYIPCGDPIEFCHIDEYETNEIKEYVTELQLPVKTSH